jgi:hypothetical protein
VRVALAIALSLGACVAEDPMDPVVTTMPDELDTTVGLTSFAVSASRMDDVDVCGLAAELPGDNACSLMCDPDAFAARLVDDGMSSGRCYQLRCALDETTTVSVGVCLP